jgi:hypothetical protein
MSLRVRDHFRAHGRRRVSLTATLRRASAEGKGAGEAVRIRDIGLGGACVEAVLGEPPLRLEASVVLEVVAPTLWDPLVLRGRVAWLRPGRTGEASRFGVRFDHAEQGGVFALFHLLGANTYDR